MKRLFINGELKGRVRRIFRNEITGRWTFCLIDSAAISLSDSEITALGFSMGDASIRIATKHIDIPEGFDADTYGSLIAK